jgi:hypothetical protein
MVARIEQSQCPNVVQRCTKIRHVAPQRHVPIIPLSYTLVATFRSTLSLTFAVCRSPCVRIGQSVCLLPILLLRMDRDTDQRTDGHRLTKGQGEDDTECGDEGI